MRTTPTNTWLRRAVAALRPLFEQAGFPIPEGVKAACTGPCPAPPSTPLRRKKRVVGQCSPSWDSPDGINEIFVSHVLKEKLEVLEVLVHELCHAVDDCEHGHRAPFAKIARAVGLEGKPTSTRAGDNLTAALVALDLPAYPMPSLTVTRTRKLREHTHPLNVHCAECGGLHA